MRLLGADVVALTLIVWVIYTSDRLLDGWTGKSRTALQERHRFCARHRGALSCLLALATGVGLWVVAGHLARVEAIAGIKLGAIVCVYMGGIHAWGGRMARFVPKEAAVGVLFSAGTTLPLWSQGAGFSWDVWASLALFALLCFLNCVSIECWESCKFGTAWYAVSHPAVRWSNSRISWMAAGVAASAVAVLLARRGNGSDGSELWGVSLAALLILLLNSRRDRFSAPVLRVLADAALVVAGVAVLMTRI